LREGAPDIRRKLAAQEMAAAALCSIGHLSSTNGSSADISSPLNYPGRHPENTRGRNDEALVEGERPAKKHRVGIGTMNVRASKFDDRDDRDNGCDDRAACVGDSDCHARE
jgi:hypothetical protein